MLANLKTVPHETYEGMYRLQWRNGDLSSDFYNLSRANCYANFNSVKRLKPGKECYTK